MITNLLEKTHVQNTGGYKKKIAFLGKNKMNSTEGCIRNIFCRDGASGVAVATASRYRTGTTFDDRAKKRLQEAAIMFFRHRRDRNGHSLVSA